MLSILKGVNTVDLSFPCNSKLFLCVVEDQWLLNHIRGCKFSLQQAKQQYNLYCMMQLTAPEFFENRNPFHPEIQEILNRRYTYTKVFF